jgi:diguanylate cyclase (GGDEF)-like protein
MLRYLIYGLSVLLPGVAVHEVATLQPAAHDLVHGFYVLVLTALVVRLRMSLDAQQALARTDPLTGVPNRRTFIEAAEARIRRMRREPGACTVVYLDIDGFKHVNDQRGHAAGDQLLRLVATTLSANVRGCDTVARLGGDEFAVLLEGADPAPVLERLRSALGERAAGAGFDVGFSIGAVTFRAPPSSAEEMLRRTDAAMYQAKARGGEVVVRVA